MSTSSCNRSSPATVQNCTPGRGREEDLPWPRPRLALWRRHFPFVLQEGTTRTSRCKLTEEIRTCHKEEFPGRGGCLWGLLPWSFPSQAWPEGCPLEGHQGLLCKQTQQTRELPFASGSRRHFLLWFCKAFSGQDLFLRPGKSLSSLPSTRGGFAPATFFCQRETRLKKHFSVGHR